MVLLLKKTASWKIAAVRKRMNFVFREKIHVSNIEHEDWRAILQQGRSQNFFLYVVIFCFASSINCVAKNILTLLFETFLPSFGHYISNPTFTHASIYPSIFLQQSSAKRSVLPTKNRHSCFHFRK